jgi:thiol-disulfide isomerase/thioredoxin
MSLRNCRSVGCSVLLVLVGLTVVGARAGAADAPKEAMPRITYAQLGQFVHDNQNKVIYVDLWQFSCVPCKRSMPELARLQEKYGSRGFLAVTVNLDDRANADLTKRSLDFLGREDLNLKGLTHFQLDEAPDFGEKVLGLNSVPRGYLFNRAGRLVHKSDMALEYNVLSKEIEELLEAK